jgi:hypothetical protein
MAEAERRVESLVVSTLSFELQQPRHRKHQVTVAQLVTATSTVTTLHTDIPRLSE